jgi:outer membrane cobalamin receptor
MKKITLSLLSILFYLTTFAQTEKRIKIINILTREPLENALLTLKRQNKNLLADAKGEIILEAVAATDTLLISYIGYETKTVIGYELSNNTFIELYPSALSLKEVTIVSKAGANFSTISKIDLNLRPARSSQDLLRLMPGLFIAQHAGGGKAEQIFLRGFDIDHGTDININVDGMPVNMVSHAHGQGYADLHFSIPELVKNIDFAPGLYNAQQGNMAVAGHVNFNTINSLANNTIKTEAGQFNTFRTVALIDLLEKKAKEKNTNWYTAGEFLYTDGPFESSQHFRRYNLFSKFSSPVTRKSFLTLQASAFTSNWDASGQVPERAVANGTITRFGAIDNTEGGQTGRTNFNAILKTVINKNSSWTDQLYYNRYNFELYSNFTFFLNDSINGDQIRQKEKRDIFGYLGKLEINKQWNNWNSKTIAAIGLRHDKTKDSELSSTRNRTETLQQIQLGDIKETNAFAWAEQSFTNNKWVVSIASRFDYFNFGYTDRLQNNLQSNNTNAIVSPKLSVQYTLNTTTQLYIKTGKGFHSNDTRLVIANTTKEILPAAYGTDLGVLLKPHQNLIINAAVWYLYLQQEFVYVGDAGVVEPSGKTRRTGADLSIRYQISKHFFTDANINYTHPRALNTAKGENYIPLAPTLSSVGGISYQSTKGFNGSLRYRYIKDRAANETNTVIAKGYTLADATINYTQKKYELGMVAENIFNTKWNEAQFNTESRLKNEPVPVEEIHFTPGSPFNLRLKLSVFF